MTIPQMERLNPKLAEFHTRNKDSFNHAQELIKPWGGLEPMIDWCKTNCTQDWRWQMVDMSTDIRPGRYIFYFDGHQDAVAFALKWC
jgi:hypothetical protein